MNISKYSKTLGAMIAAVFVAALASEAQAGPGPHEVFTAVKTMKQAQSLPVGTRIAISCGNCNGVTTLTVDEGRSYLKGFTCPSCKRTFQIMPGGGSRAANQLAYVDKSGQYAYLSAARKL